MVVYHACEINPNACGSVAKASDTQAVIHEYEPRPDHYNRS